MDPHRPTIAPRCPTAVIADKIHFQKESKNLFLPTISVLSLCNQSAQLFQPLATRLYTPICRRKVVTTDASNKGLGALCEDKLTFSLWSEEESGLHINCLEMLALCQACQFFLPDIRGHHVLIRSDSRSVKSPGRPRLEATQYGMTFLCGLRTICAH